MHILLKYDIISVRGDSYVLQMVQFLCINSSKEFKIKVNIQGEVGKFNTSVYVIFIQKCFSVRTA